MAHKDCPSEPLTCNCRAHRFVADPKGFVADKLKEHAVSTLFLHLVCEV